MSGFALKTIPRCFVHGQLKFILYLNELRKVHIIIFRFIFYFFNQIIFMNNDTNQKTSFIFIYKNHE